MAPLCSKLTLNTQRGLRDTDDANLSAEPRTNPYYIILRGILTTTETTCTMLCCTAMLLEVLEGSGRGGGGGGGGRETGTETQSNTKDGLDR